MKNKFKLIILSVAAIIAGSPLIATNDYNVSQPVFAATTTKKNAGRSTTKGHRNAHKIKVKAAKQTPPSRGNRSKLKAKKPANVKKLTQKSKAARGGSGNVLKPKVGTRPQDNLYLAINSKWMKKAKIPADATSTGTFDELDLKITNELSQDMADFADGKKQLPNLPNFDKAVELYKLARDFDQRNRDGAEPIKTDLAQLEGITDFADFNTKAAKLYDEGFSLPIDISVSPDMKNAKKNALWFSPTGTILPDKSSYQDANAKQLLDIYQKQSVDLLKMAGVSEDQATSYAEQAIKFDSLLAQNVKSAEENADDASQYNPMSMQDFKSKFTDFDIQQFLQGTIGKEPEQIIVTDPDFLNNVNKIVNKDNFADLKGWLIVMFINNSASELSQNFREASFPFAQAVTGQAKLSSGDKQAFEIVDNVFGDLIGIYYGQTYFGEDAKKDVTSMIEKILKTYEKRLQNNDWLSKATKQQAIDKLKAMKVKVGYPDGMPLFYWRTQIVPASKGGSLYSNVRAMQIENIKENFAQLFQPADRNGWGIAGDQVDAAYIPQTNSVIVPAAILQAPFYDKKQSQAANLGGIGAVVGHEISHAFDNNGARYDKEGDMRNWWTKKDYAEFKKKIKAEINLFNGIKYGSSKLNGKQIVSENIADQGGLTVAIQVAKSEGDNLRELFENNARVWKMKTTPQAIKYMLSIDVHAPNPLRANVQAQCQNEFYKTFKVKSTDGMWLSPKKRVHIW